MGMSTVFEVCEAAHFNLPLFAMSFITNQAKGAKEVGLPAASHGEVLSASEGEKSRHLRLVVKKVLEKIDTAALPETRAVGAYGPRAAGFVAKPAPSAAATNPVGVVPPESHPVAVAPLAVTPIEVGTAHSAHIQHSLPVIVGISAAVGAIAALLASRLFARA